MMSETERTDTECKIFVHLQNACIYIGQDMFDFIRYQKVCIQKIRY